jgi:hypothetical protein
MGLKNSYPDWLNDRDQDPVQPSRLRSRSGDEPGDGREGSDDRCRCEAHDDR